MQKYFNNMQEKYSGRSQLEGDPRSPSSLSQRSFWHNARPHAFTGAFPQPKRYPKQRIGNFAYPTRKVSDQPDEADPHFNPSTSGSNQKRPTTAFVGNSVPKWDRLHDAYSKGYSIKRS